MKSKAAWSDRLDRLANPEPCFYEVHTYIGVILVHEIGLVPRFQAQIRCLTQLLLQYGT